MKIDSRKPGIDKSLVALLPSLMHNESPQTTLNYYIGRPDETRNLRTAMAAFEGLLEKPADDPDSI